jgi:RNA polymerase sigma-70 factor (ECF subfamily)
MSQPIRENICEEALFERLYKKHARGLHNFLNYKFGATLNPEDKVQEAFVKLWENCNKVSLNKAKSYLYTTANNLMLNAAAHHKVVLNHQKNPTKYSTNESPEFLLREKEFHEKLKKALSNLTEAQRTAFLMNRIEGLRFKEIAERLNISTKAVEKRIYGALNKLRKDIEGI